MGGFLRTENTLRTNKISIYTNTMKTHRLFELRVSMNNDNSL